MYKVLVCIDGSNLSKAVCDYGIYIAKNLNLPLVLLNVVESSNNPKKIDLSGNIGLGEKDDLLEELSNKDANESKEQILKGKNILKQMQEYVKNKGFENCTTLQKRGNLYETLDELSNSLKLAIIGIKGENSSKIGDNVEELIRTLNIPILLVNKEFSPIKSILMAYDGSEYANKSIKVATLNPIFPNTKRVIVNVNKDLELSTKLLNEAKELFSNSNMEVDIKSLNKDKVEAILDYQKEKSLDIIAMGAYSKNRFKSAIFGSFTTKMLLNSKVPLLLFR